MSFSGIIKNCRDSHVHWLATGQSHTRLNLRELNSPREVSKLEIRNEFFRGDWLIGFGWDDNRWAGNEMPNRFILDELFPEIPVAFSRADGHGLWVNTEALRRSGLLESKKEVPGGKIVVGNDRRITGVLIDLACEPVFALIPESSSTDLRNALVSGMKVFNRAGFTHIRDMTCNLAQWQQELALDKSGLLTLAVEQYFNVGEPTEFAGPLGLAVESSREPLKNIRVAGLKVYFDGALGSEGALLSQCYCGKDHRGLQIMTCELLAEIMTKTWDTGLDLAVHAIGDQATHLVVSTALNVWSKKDQGKLHIEHAEVVRPDTISQMKGKRIQCHLQPCHFLSDKLFLKNKLAELYPFIFPIVELQRNEIKFDFGSDSPIEPPSISDNLVALHELGYTDLNITLLHGHVGDRWTEDSWTEFENGKPKKVLFRGQSIL